MLGASLRIGKIAGIRIGINYSLFFIAALVTFQLAGIVLPERAPGYSDAIYWSFSVFGAVLFFSSILWHELAHALMARFYGIPVHQIVLFFLGGVAQIEREPRKALQEFWIVIVGPLSSLVLGGMFLGVSFLLRGSPILAEVFFWLGIINIMLAIFNMVPGFPLDGGRVFRAIVWGLSGDYLKATRWASLLGQGLAYMLILSGFVSLFTPQTIIGGGFFSVLLGFFLLSAAKQHLRDATLRAGLQGVAVGQLVNWGRALESDWPLAYAIDMMAVGGVTSAAPVTRNGQLVGVLTVENFRVLPRLHWGNVSVETVMIPIHQLRTVDAHRNLYDTLRDSDLNEQSYLLVVNEQRPVGLLSQRDILRFTEQRLRSS